MEWSPTRDEFILIRGYQPAKAGWSDTWLTLLWVFFVLFIGEKHGPNLHVLGGIPITVPFGSKNLFFSGMLLC